jgi:pyroglutamyl-peptidase
MKKLLITGFEPFGGEDFNPSWETVKRLPDTIGEYELTKLCLPVIFGEAADMVIQASKECSPDVILCTGLAGGRAAITPEMVGINLRHATIPDHRGYQPKDEPIAADDETAYFSTLPIRNMAQAMQAAGIPSAVSYSAGTYVCNDVLFTLLARFKGTKTGVGFIHVPYASEQKKQPCMELCDMVKGVTIAIEHLN